MNQHYIGYLLLGLVFSGAAAIFGVKVRDTPIGFALVWLAGAATAYGLFVK